MLGVWGLKSGLEVGNHLSNNNLIKEYVIKEENKSQSLGRVNSTIVWQAREHMSTRAHAPTIRATS